MKKCLLVGLFALAPFAIASADLKVAVIDLSKTFDQYYKTQAAQAKLKTEGDQYQKDYQDMVTDYQHMGEEAQKLQDSANDQTLSKDARDDKAKALTQKKQDLVNMQRKIEEMSSERRRELQEEMARRRKEILDEITKVVNDYSAPQGFDVVLDKTSLSASGAPIMLYNSSKLIDITAEIITKLNATRPPGTPAAAGAPAAPAPATPAAPAVPVN